MSYNKKKSFPETGFNQRSYQTSFMKFVCQSCLQVLLTDVSLIEINELDLVNGTIISVFKFHSSMFTKGWLIKSIILIN